MDSPLPVEGAEQNAPGARISRSKLRAHRFHKASRIGAGKNPGAALHGHTNTAKADQTGGAQNVSSADFIKQEKKGPVSVGHLMEIPIPAEVRVLQFLPSASNLARDSRDGSGNRGPRLGDRRDCGTFGVRIRMTPPPLWRLINMKTLRLTSDDFDKLRQLQIKRGWKRLAFSTNYREEIWPSTRFGPVPIEEREELGGVCAMLDQVVAEYLKVRSEGGRFFVQRDGVWYEEEGYLPVQFVAFQFYGSENSK
jgi:hypothetical protein